MVLSFAVLCRAKSEIFYSRLGVCVEITASVRYLQTGCFVNCEKGISYSTCLMLSGWMSGWMKRDGVLSSFHFNVFRNSV